MKELEVLFVQQQNKELEWIPTLQILNQLQNDGKIILYAGTYSFEEALKRPYCDFAYFYFYSVLDKKGYCFHISCMGISIYFDDEIFEFSHRRLYNKGHMSCNYEEAKLRSGEYYNRK